VTDKALRTIFHSDEIPTDLHEYFEPVRNIHPTIKNVKLTQWLATLLLPPAEYAPRRILVPFTGVMSEGIGCMLAGWEEIVAVELMEEYVQIGEARMRFWSARMQETQSSDPHAILKTCGKGGKGKQDCEEHSPDENRAQMSLLESHDEPPVS